MVGKEIFYKVRNYVRFPRLMVYLNYHGATKNLSACLRPSPLPSLPLSPRYLKFLLLPICQTSVPIPSIQADSTQHSNPLHFSCVLIFLPHVIPSILLHAASPACTIVCHLFMIY